MMTDQVPADATLGELWRGQIALHERVVDVGTKVDRLSGTISAELDRKVGELEERIKEELSVQWRAHSVEHKLWSLRHSQLAEKLRLIDRSMRAVAAFAAAGVGTIAIARIFGG